MATPARRFATNSDISANPRSWERGNDIDEVDRLEKPKFSSFESMSIPQDFLRRPPTYAPRRPKTRAKLTTGQFPACAYGVRPIRGWMRVRITFASYSGAVLTISPR